MAEPLSLEQAKAQLRVLDTNEDDDIAAAIVDARGWIENYTGLILTRRLVAETLVSFDARLSTWPIVSVDSVGYVDHAGGAATLLPADYVANIARRPARLWAPNWPRAYPRSAVTVIMTAGFADAAAVSAFSPNILRAMRLLVAGYYRDRETGGIGGDVEIAAQRLCRSLKRWSL